MSELLIDVIAPVTEISGGGFAFDPIKLALGCSLPEKMAPVLRGETERRDMEGKAYYFFPCAFPDGISLELNLRVLGNFSIANDGGRICLTLPQFMLSQVEDQLGEYIADRQDLNPGAVVWLRVEAGVSFIIPMGGLGNLGIMVPAVSREQVITGEVVDIS